MFGVVQLFVFKSVDKFVQITGASSVLHGIAWSLWYQRWIIIRADSEKVYSNDIRIRRVVICWKIGLVEPVDIENLFQFHNNCHTRGHDIKLPEKRCRLDLIPGEWLTFNLFNSLDGQSVTVTWQWWHRPNTLAHPCFVWRAISRD